MEIPRKCLTITMLILAVVALMTWSGKQASTPSMATYFPAPRSRPSQKVSGHTTNPTHKISENARLQLQPDPEVYPTIIASRNRRTRSDTNSCVHLCGENGDCTSAAFFECVQRDPLAFGIRGIKRTAFGPGNRRISYDMFTSRQKM